MSCKITWLFVLLALIQSTLSVTVQLHWEVKEMLAYPDGMLQAVIAINGAFPGPTIRIDMGDVLHVTVKNLLSETTSVHWHGIEHNFGHASTFMDGVEGVTQCGIRPGYSFTYKFTPQEPGTHWYHAHSHGQRTEGFYGTLIVNPTNESANPLPNEYRYDEDFVVMIHEAYHVSDKRRVELYEQATSLDDVFCVQSLLCNGKGVFNCSMVGQNVSYPYCPQHLYNTYSDCREGEYERYSVTTGNTYMLRIVAAMSDLDFVFSVDDHDVDIISSDAHFTKRLSSGGFHLHSGETYDVLLTANKESGSYWIRLEFPAEGSKNEADNHKFAILSYNGDESIPVSTTNQHDRILDTITQLEPYYYRQVPGFNTETYMRFEPGPTEGPSWTVNDVAFEVPETPFIFGGGNKDSMYTVPLGSWVQIVLNNPFNTGFHPMHIHGHSFYVMGSGAYNGSYKSEYSKDFKQHPVLKHTVSMPPNGWTVVRFKADNPGFWFLHCHKELHFAKGMAAVIHEFGGPLHVPRDIEKWCVNGQKPWWDRISLGEKISVVFVPIGVVLVLTIVWAVFTTIMWRRSYRKDKLRNNYEEIVTSTTIST